jgi:hypothetical protein
MEGAPNCLFIGQTGQNDGCAGSKLPGTRGDLCAVKTERVRFGAIPAENDEWIAGSLAAVSQYVNPSGIVELARYAREQNCNAQRNCSGGCSGSQHSHGPWFVDLDWGKRGATCRSSVFRLGIRSPRYRSVRFVVHCDRAARALAAQELLRLVVEGD